MTDPTKAPADVPVDLESALGELLQEVGFTAARVKVMGESSVGAVRSTLFIEIASDDAHIPAVAQIGGSDYLSASCEAEVLNLADSSGVPVPRVLAATETLGGQDCPVLVTGRLDGLSIPRQILRSIPNDAAGDALAAECGQALARLHAIERDSVPHCVEGLDPDAPFADYCSSLAESLDELPTRHPAIRLGLNWLGRNPPAIPPRLALVHADFRNGNILVRDGHLEAVLDWELVHIGDPMEDLAWLCVRMWRFGRDDRPCGGFGSIGALRSGYESAGGMWREDAFDWWLIARTAWWGIGLARQGASFLSGESDSIVHAASGRRVPELEYDLLTLIRTKEHK